MADHLDTHCYLVITPEQALLDSPEMLRQITSKFVLILETDHVLMRPIPNLATESKPAAFVFGYMHGHKSQDGIVRR